MHASVLLSINEHMTFEISRFTDVKDMIGGLKSNKWIT